jgi:hypothetical protein
MSTAPRVKGLYSGFERDHHAISLLSRLVNEATIMRNYSDESPVSQYNPLIPTLAILLIKLLIFDVLSGINTGPAPGYKKVGPTGGFVLQRAD